MTSLPSFPGQSENGCIVGSATKSSDSPSTMLRMVSLSNHRFGGNDRKGTEAAVVRLSQGASRG